MTNLQDYSPSIDTLWIFVITNSLRHSYLLLLKKLSCLNKEYAQIKHLLRLQAKTVLNKYFAQFDKRAAGDGLFYWKKHYYGLWTLVFWPEAWFKWFKRIIFFKKHAAFQFTRCKLICRSRVDHLCIARKDVSQSYQWVITLKSVSKNAPPMDHSNERAKFRVENDHLYLNYDRFWWGEKKA